MTAEDQGPNRKNPKIAGKEAGAKAAGRAKKERRVQQMERRGVGRTGTRVPKGTSRGKSSDVNGTAQYRLIHQKGGEATRIIT